VLLEDEVDNNDLVFEQDSDQEDAQGDFELASFGGDTTHPVDTFQDQDGSGIGIGFPTVLFGSPASDFPPLTGNRLNQSPTTPDSATRKHSIAVTKRKHKRSKRKKQDTEDFPHRPDSSQFDTQPLQTAKTNQRIAQQKRRAQNSKMPVQTRRSNPNDFDRDPANGENNSSQLGDVPRKNSATRSPSEVTTNSSTSDETLVESPPAEEASTEKSLPKKKKSSRLADNHSAWVTASKYKTKDIDQLVAEQRVKDAKLNQDQRKIELDKCRRKIWLLQIARGKDQVYMKELEDAQKKQQVYMQKMNDHIFQLEQAATQSISRAKAAKLRICSEQKEKVIEKTKQELWRTTKFVTSKDQLESATEKVLDFLHLGKKTQQERDSWIITYKTVVKKALNNQRNYLTAELKKVAWEYFKQGQELPAVTLLLSLAMRKVSTENKPKFKWWWTKVLPKVVGAKQWNKEIFYYHTILKAKMDMTDPDSSWLFTVSHEAMICLVWENNWEKWQEQYKWSLLPENKGKELPNLAGKWSSSKSGQAEWGGWNMEGLEKFNEYKTQIRAGRKGRLEEIHALEEETLAELRKEVGIDQDDHETQLRMNRAKKRKMNADKPVEDIRVHKSVLTVDDEDEEDDER